MDEELNKLNRKSFPGINKCAVEIELQKKES